MNYQTRHLPSQESLRRVSEEFGSERSSQDVELILLVLNVANRFRCEVFSSLEKHYGLTEGKFILLMALSDSPQGLPINELAKRVGVTTPTVSIMIKRMLAAENRLIAVHSSQADGRVRKIVLTESGHALLAEVLPVHLKQISDFSQTISSFESKTLTTLLRKLL